MYNLTVDTAHTFFVGEGEWLVHNTGGKCFGFSFNDLNGKSAKWLKRNRPDGWKTAPTDNGLGWKWLDENGNERLRFYRPSGSNAANSQWARQENGYLRWQDADGNYLDVNGSIVPKADPDFQWKTHIPYEGVRP